jgi:surface polysaccharide O-acyltransferase-like enzyme
MLAMFLLMPVAYYPAYRVTAADPSVAAYWQHWRSLPFWPTGPQWFLWQLVALNIVAAALYRFAPRSGDFLGRLASSAREHPIRYFIGLVAVSAVAYIPLALIFTPWTWTHFGPFAFQLARPLHYSVYFFAGVGIGVHGLERGLLAPDGGLARTWLAWLAAALVTLGLWMGPTALVMDYTDKAPLILQLAGDLGFVLACASGCFFFVATFLRFGQHRSRTYDSLSECAYGMYLVHYVFVVWMQYALLNVALFAIAKAAIVFGVTLMLSWGTVVAMQRVPLGSRMIGVRR